MAQRWTCPQGHQGEADLGESGRACPVCGSPVDPIRNMDLQQPDPAPAAPPDRLPAAPGLPHTLPAPNPGAIGFSFPDDFFPTPTRPTGGADAPGQADGGARPAVPGYEILSELGRGGMGVVYKARQLSLNRTVALKMILSGAHAGQQEVTRFKIEAAAIARLQHPNIVQIHEVGEHEGRPYFSLELVDGGSLAERVEKGPLPAREAARLVERLARAVHAAHRQGIVHRDLKPGNVLLTAEGEPKITDFGLAKQVAGPGTPPGEALSGQTQSGAIMGTPSYMAPEQARGQARDVSPAADIWALGGILYELLTGQPPFQANTPWETVGLVLTEDPVRPRSLVRQVPRDLETIVLKCLEKEPILRYASAEVLADDLRRFQAGDPVLAQPPTLTYVLRKFVLRHRARLTILLLLLAGLVSGGLLLAGTIRERYLRRELERQWAAHPEVHGRPVDPGQIKFSHRLHMLPGMTDGRSGKSFTLAQIDPFHRERYRQEQPATQREDGAPVRLTCGSCHRFEKGSATTEPLPELPGGILPVSSAGAYGLPITYENQCRACHPLKLELPQFPSLSVPHRLQQEELRRFLEEAIGEVLKRNPMPPRLLGKDRLLPNRDRVELAERLLLGSKLGTGCVQCHQVETGAEPRLVPRIVPAAIPDTWFDYAVFNHAAHRRADCRLCHPRAYPDSAEASTRSADVLIPGVDVCRQCHGPLHSSAGVPHGGARFDCGTCHRYRTPAGG